MTSAPDGSDTADATPILGEAVITLPNDAAAPGGAGLVQAPMPGLSTPVAQRPSADHRAGRPHAGPGLRPARSPPTASRSVGLIIGGLGLNAKATREAIESLPPEVTLSFVPYADGLQGWIDMARAAGHEVLLEAPMEPKDYPDNDPGPYTLMADGQPPETTQRLDWLLSRATGYFGVTNYLGSKFVDFGRRP